MSSPWLLVARVGVVLAVVVSLLVVRRLDSRNRGVALRERFVMGVPWGTLLTVAGLLAVYLFVQGGFSHWNEPVALPFRAWSYLYPLGMVVSPFAHVGPSHLLGNLIGTLALAPLAEYAWSHYPPERDSGSSLPTTPIARVLAVPAVVVLAGLFTSFFALGPVIGFSGVVFAFAGFTLVRYPLATVVAYSASDILRQVYNAVQNPVVTASAEPGFGPPWWASVAIQTHAIGLLLGVLVGVALLRRRSEAPSAGRLWLGTLVFATSQSLWAVYWFRGSGTFVLFRALGVVLVFGLALLVAASVADADISIGRPFGGVERRGAAAVVVLLALAALAAPAIPVNLTTVDSSAARATAPGANTTETSDLTVRDYTVTYAENVTNQQVAVFDISVFGETTEVNASGVIVKSERRHLWTTAVRKSRLAFAGCVTVRLGGLGWAESIHVSRTGWRVVGGERAYTIRLGRQEPTQVAYLSEPATAAATIRGKNVSVVPRKRGFALAVSRANETLARVPVPNANETTRAANLTFSREGKRLFVTVGGTRVRIAKAETYS